jgi:tetratricopeptide (TPR) repeat protein
LLEVVALAGVSMPMRSLAKACSLTLVECERAAAQLRVASLIRVSRLGDEPWLAAYHDKVCEAVSEQLSTEHAAALHERLAVTIQEQGEEDGTSRPVLLAHHWRAAGQAPRAATYLLEAARGAAKTHDMSRAAELYEQILELSSALPSDPHFEIIMCRARIGLADAMRVIERHSDALALLDRAQASATRHQLTAELAELHTLRGNILVSRGDLEGCLAEHQYGLVFARQAGSPRCEARALGGLGDASFIRGRFRAAFTRFDDCIELCRHHGLRGIECANLSMRGITRYYLGELALGLEDSREALAIAVMVGHQRAEINARVGCLAPLLIEMERLEEARAECHQALSKARRLGARRFELFALLGLSRIAGVEGNRREAQMVAEQSLELARRIGFAFVGPLTLGLLARVSHGQSRRRQALDEGEASLRDNRMSYNHLSYYRDAIDTAFALVEPDEIDRYADALEAYMRPYPLPWGEFFVARGRALAQVLRGTPDTDQLHRLCEQARSVGYRHAAHALQAALGQASSGS